MSYLPSKRALLDRFRAGDQAALSEVYAHYAPSVVRCLQGGFPVEFRGEPGRFRGVSTPLDLADAVQEVFARALGDRARLEYDGLKPYGAYLAGIARNVVVDHLRRRESGIEAIAELSAEPSPLAPLPPDLVAEEAEVARLVDSFLARLGDVERRVYERRFQEERTQEDAARALGMTRIQVRRAERRLRKGLLDHLKHNGYLEDFRIEGWGLARLRLAASGKARR